MAEDLARYLAGEPIAARATGMLERGWLWCRRNPRLAGAIGSTAAALVAVAVISAVYAVEQSRARNRIGGLLDESKQLTRALKDSLAHSNQLAGDLETSLKESERNQAAATFERARLELERDYRARGLLALVETWRAAERAADPDWQRTARSALAVWCRMASPLKGFFEDTPHWYRPIVAFCPGRRRRSWEAKMIGYASWTWTPKGRSNYRSPEESPPGRSAVTGATSSSGGPMGRHNSGTLPPAG